MTDGFSRRAVLAAIMATAAAPALAQGKKPAPEIDDPLATAFDIGPADAPWRIFCGQPSAPPPADGYSVLIALDGNGTFPILWNLRASMAPVLLVGIGYPSDARLRRWYDLTSPAMMPVPPVEGMRGPGEHPTGGSAAFRAMIAGPLIAELQARFAVDTADMTLFGHSLGGLFTLQTLLSTPRLFARYAAADPSTWWNGGETLDRIEAFASGVAATGGAVRPRIPVLISTAGSGTPEAVRFLSRIPGIDVTHRAHPSESHGSVLHPAAREALALHTAR